MDQHNATPDTQERSSVGRRTVLKGAAWSVPVVAVVGATPAFAKTGDTVSFTTVTVSPAPTGAPSLYYINISNQDSTVIVGGDVTSGAVVTVTATGGYSEKATTTGTTWTHTIPAGSLPQGTLSFTASVAGPPVVSPSGPHTVVKDTVAPTATAEATLVDASNNNKQYTISGTRSADMKVNPTVTGLTRQTLTYPDSTHWSATFNGGSNQAYSGSVSVVDDAGNPGPSDTFSWPKNASFPHTL